MGGSTSKLEKALGTAFPEDERYYGLENFGNTCYCNSVLQALYYCQPFRKQVLNYLNEADETGTSKDGNGQGEDANLLSCLSELFANISSAKKKTGVIAPRKFVQKVRKENELFRSYMHQDAHEFLNYVLNEIDEILRKEAQSRGTPSSGSSASSSTDSTGGSDGGQAKPRPEADRPSTGNVRTWIHDIFQGTLTNETKCLCCENVTSKDESFLDLSLDIEQNASITSCLRNFSSTETLNHADKFYCDSCCSLQEAQKRMKVKRLPKILALHLKRFKYMEQIQRYKKLSYRVVFPLELKLCNTAEVAEDPDREYHLFAVVIHVGSGPNHGHYISIIRSHNHWLIFDDDTVELIEEHNVQTCFGSTQDAAAAQNTDAGYILFYAAADAGNNGS